MEQYPISIKSGAATYGTQWINLVSRDGTRASRGIQSDAKAESLQQNAAMKSEQCIQTHDQIVLY